MKASEYIARYIEGQGVTHVFELVGGMITFLVDSLHQYSNVRIVSMHHEQGRALLRRATREWPEFRESRWRQVAPAQRIF